MPSVWDFVCQQPDIVPKHGNVFPVRYHVAEDAFSCLSCEVCRRLEIWKTKRGKKKCSAVAVLRTNLKLSAWETFLFLNFASKASCADDRGAARLLIIHLTFLRAQLKHSSRCSAFHLQRAGDAESLEAQLGGLKPEPSAWSWWRVMKPGCVEIEAQPRTPFSSACRGRHFGAAAECPSAWWPAVKIFNLPPLYKKMRRSRRVTELPAVCDPKKMSRGCKI